MNRSCKRPGGASRRRLRIEPLERRDLLAGEVIELMLTARTDDDQPIVPDSGGVINLDVDQAFNLEVSYNDLRLFRQRRGVFQLLADVSLSQKNVLEPILNEAQRLLVGEEILQGENLSGQGTLTFSIEGSQTTYVSSGLDFAQDPRQEIINALTAFQYTPDQYELDKVQFRADDIGFNLVFVDPNLADQNLPNISITAANFEKPVPTRTIEFAPRNPDGTINGDAIRFNVNSFSRTFNDNEEFFRISTSGSFQPDQGFTDIGGFGGVPGGGGGVSQLSDDGEFVTPFDAFSLRVRFIEPVTDFVASLSLSENSEAILIYGADDAVPLESVLIDEDASVRFNVNGIDENAVDENAVDENAVDENAVDENAVDENAVDENAVDENAVDENGVDENGVDENGVDENAVDENAVDENAVDENAVDENAVDENAVDENAVDENAVDENAVDENAVDENAVDENAVDENAVDENAVDENAVDENGVDENDVDENGVDESGVDENGDTQLFDFGDAPLAAQSGLPSSYPTSLEDDGARHTITVSPVLGSFVDAEQDGLPSPGATGDDDFGSDEDGVFANSSIVTNTSTPALASFQITTMGGGIVDAWIDANRDGDWDDQGEYVFAGMEVPNGTSIHSFLVPESAVPGETFARFRLTTDGISSPRGHAFNGEVEDLAVTILDGSQDPDVAVGVTGFATVEIVAGNIVINSASAGTFRVPVGEIGTQTIFGSALPDTISLDFSGGNLVPAGGLEIDGLGGENTLRVLGAGADLDLTSGGNIRVRNFATLDLSDPGPANVTIDALALRDLVAPATTTRFVGGEADTLTFLDAPQWRMSERIVRDGQVILTATNQASGEMIEASVPHAFQNLVTASDINNDGVLTPNDALMVIEELAHRRFSSEADQRVDDPLTIISWPKAYYDQNADDKITALDALRVINQFPRTEVSDEGEATEVIPLIEQVDDGEQSSENRGFAFDSIAPSEKTETGVSQAATGELATQTPVPLALETSDPADEIKIPVDELLSDGEYVASLSK